MTKTKSSFQQLFSKREGQTTETNDTYSKDIIRVKRAIKKPKKIRDMLHEEQTKDCA